MLALLSGGLWAAALAARAVIWLTTSSISCESPGEGASAGSAGCALSKCRWNSWTLWNVSRSQRVQVYLLRIRRRAPFPPHLFWWSSTADSCENARRQTLQTKPASQVVSTAPSTEPGFRRMLVVPSPEVEQPSRTFWSASGSSCSCSTGVPLSCSIRGFTGGGGGGGCG